MDNIRTNTPEFDPETAGNPGEMEKMTMYEKDILNGESAEQTEAAEDTFAEKAEGIESDGDAGGASAGVNDGAESVEGAEGAEQLGTDEDAEPDEAGEGAGTATMTESGESESAGEEASDGEAADKKKTPRITRKRKKEETPAEDSAVEADVVEDSSDKAEDVPAPKKPTLTKEERDRIAAERRRERIRQQRQNAVLDEAGNPIMDGDGTFEDEIAEIFRMKNTRQICNGYIDEIKQGRGNSEDYVEVMYNGFRVLIPFSEMDVQIEPMREDETEKDYNGRMFTTVSNMLGAEIDFIIRDVSIEDRLAAASRAQATKIKRRDILNATDRDGNFRVYEGRRCTARVLATHPTFAFLEVYGMRVRLRARDIRSEFVSDVTKELQNGENITVYVTFVERDKKGEVTEMYVSMRNDAQERKELERKANDLRVGDICRGRVSSRSRKVIFIRLNNGVHCYCHVTNGLQGRSIPNVGDSVSIRILKKTVNNSNGNPLMQGKIVRNIKWNVK